MMNTQFIVTFIESVTFLTVGGVGRSCCQMALYLSCMLISSTVIKPLILKGAIPKYALFVTKLALLVTKHNNL